jgi:two-component system KDP operon response regulator KdpE
LTDERPAHILVVEDDAALREILAGALDSAGYETSLASHGITASQRLRDPHSIDIVLLDIGLPFVDGWQILEQMDNRHRPAVIVISARGEETDKVRALDLGADDYLAKPFGADELLARVRAVLRRVRPPAGAGGVVAQGGVRVDLGARSVTRDGQEVRLSPTEWLLLAELAARLGTSVRGRAQLSPNVRAAPARQARGRPDASGGGGDGRPSGLPVRPTSLTLC